MFNGEILAFVLYFVFMLGVGVFFFIKTKDNANEEEYFLGGRSMGPWVTALSAQASDMSAWLLMGLPGSMLAFGMGQAWIGIGLALGTIANWFICAKRLRKFSKASGDSITLPQYLTNRFASNSKALSIICAAIFLFAFTVYVASAFIAGATVFTTLIDGLPTSTAMIIFAAIIIVYTFLGGFKAVSWTDFFQGTLMFVALLAVPILIVVTGKQNSPEMAKNLAEIVSADGTVYPAFVANLFDASWKDIVSGLGWGLGYFGMPHIIVRFMAIEKPSMIKKSAIVGSVWVVVSLLCAILIAYFGRMMIGEELLTAGLQKTVFIALARGLFPSFLAGILLAAIISASMSTADSQLLVASSAFTADIYKPIIRKNASEKELLWVGRIVVLVVAVIAYFIATSKGTGAQAIMDMVENAWGIFGAAFGPVIILSLFWKRFNYPGAIAGIVTGALVDILWLFLPVVNGTPLSTATGVYEIVPGFIIGAIVAVVATLLTKAPSAEVEAIFVRATDESNDD